MIQRGDKITILVYDHPTPVRGVVTIVHCVSARGRVLEYAYFDWQPIPQAVGVPTWGRFCSEYAEGWLYLHGHGEEQDRALLAAKALG